MNKKIFSRWMMVLVLLSISLLLNSASAVGAPLAGGAPVPGGPGYVSISALDFRPHGFSTAELNYDQSAIYNITGGQLALDAPVDLPDGATVNQVVVYYSAISGAATNLHVILFLHPLISNAPVTIASFSPSANTTDLLTYTDATYTGPFSFPTVALASSAYVVQVKLPSTANLRFNGVRVDYGYSTTLPAIMK